MRVLFAISLALSGLARAEHIVSQTVSHDPSGVEKRELVTSPDRCVPLFAYTKAGPIPYLLDTETRAAYYIPRLQLEGLRLTGVQASGEGKDGFENYGELTFRPAMSEASKEELSRLKRELGGKVKNLYGEEQFQLKSAIYLNDTSAKANPDGRVTLRISPHGYSVYKAVKQNPPLPSLRYPNPCGEKTPIFGRLEGLDPLSLGMRVIYVQSSMQSPGVTRQLDGLRRKRYRSRDVEDKRNIIRAGVELLLEHPSPRDRELIERLHLDRRELASELTQAYMAGYRWNDPTGALIQDTYDLAPAIWHVAVEHHDSPAFSETEETHFLVNSSAEKRAMDRMNTFSPEKIAYGRELVKMGVAIELSEPEYAKLIRQSVGSWPDKPRLLTRSRRVVDWDETDSGKLFRPRESLHYSPY